MTPINVRIATTGAAIVAIALCAGCSTSETKRTTQEPFVLSKTELDEVWSDIARPIQRLPLQWSILYCALKEVGSTTGTELRDVVEQTFRFKLNPRKGDRPPLKDSVSVLFGIQEPEGALFHRGQILGLVSYDKSKPAFTIEEKSGAVYSNNTEYSTDILDQRTIPLSGQAILIDILAANYIKRELSSGKTRDSISKQLKDGFRESINAVREVGSNSVADPDFSEIIGVILDGTRKRISRYIYNSVALSEVFRVQQLGILAFAGKFFNEKTQAMFNQALGGQKPEGLACYSAMLLLGIAKQKIINDYCAKGICHEPAEVYYVKRVPLNVLHRIKQGRPVFPK